MSKFLTPPVWYDKDGNLNDMLTGKASGHGVAIGSNAIARSYGVAVGGYADASGTAVGSYADANGGGIAVGEYADAGNGIAIGPHAIADSYGIAIGGSASEGGIAMRGTATGNGIAIGGDADANEVQLGNINTAYNLVVGDGSGTLKIGSIKFKQMQMDGYNVKIPQSGVYLCCTIYKQNPQLLESKTDVTICFIYDRSDTNQSVSMLTSTSGSCSYDKTNKIIKPGTNFTIKYCFQIVSF